MDNEDRLNFNFQVPPSPTSDLVELADEQQERRLLGKLQAAGNDPGQALWDLAQFYKRRGKLDLAIEILNHLLTLAPTLEHKAQIILTLGQTAENSKDFELAVRFYRQALSIEPCNPGHWYFIHNNLGFSLNQLGKYAEGEDYCRRAIAISEEWPNAFKNLGLALVGQCRYHEAAEAFVRATQVNASDARSLGHLEGLISEHPELEYDFASRLRECRDAVRVAREAVEKVQEQWRKVPKME